MDALVFIILLIGAGVWFYKRTQDNENRRDQVEEAANNSNFSIVLTSDDNKHYVGLTHDGQIKTNDYSEPIPARNAVVINTSDGLFLINCNVIIKSTNSEMMYKFVTQCENAGAISAHRISGTFSIDTEDESTLHLTDSNTYMAHLAVNAQESATDPIVFAGVIDPEIYWLVGINLFSRDPSEYSDNGTVIMTLRRRDGSIFRVKANGDLKKFDYIQQYFLV